MRGSGHRPRNAEMAQLVGMLKERGLSEVYTDDLGRKAYRLTNEAVQVRNMLAMVGGADADAMLKALRGRA